MSAYVGSSKNLKDLKERRCRVFRSRNQTLCSFLPPSSSLLLPTRLTTKSLSQNTKFPSQKGLRVNLSREKLTLEPWAEEEGGRGMEASSQGWVVDVLLNRKGGALHCTTRRLGGPLIGSPGNSYVAHLVSHYRSLRYQERRCGFNTKPQSAKSRHDFE